MMNKVIHHGQVWGEDSWSNAVWAWEFLRRNADYRQAFSQHMSDHPKMFELGSGSRLIVGERRYALAREWGLLCFADPELPAHEAGVFWKPSLFSATLPVTLQALGEGRHAVRQANDRIILSSLLCRKLIFESVRRSRHIVLAPRRYWIQLYCDSPHPLDDQAFISFRIEGTQHADRQIESFRQLLKLHRSPDAERGVNTRKRRSHSLSDALTALDVKADGGSYKMIATALYGKSRVEEDWSGGYSPLKQKARRALKRGRLYRDGKYLELLG